MFSRLSQAARRAQWRGLAGALTEGASSSSSSQQPMAALAMRAHSASGSAGGLPAAAGEVLRRSQARPFTAGAAAQQQQKQQQEEVEQAPVQEAQQQRQQVPAGATDFARKQLVMLFTCAKCNTRAAKAFSKASYERGVVIVDCPGCHSKHLIADHLGWFGSKGTVEEFAREKGNMVMCKLADGTTELTPEDVLGHTVLEAAAEQQQQAQEGAEQVQQQVAGSGEAGAMQR